MQDTTHRTALLAIATLSGSALAANPTVQGPGVVPGRFRVTAFATGLDYPASMHQLADGSILVAASDPAPMGGTIFNSTGTLLRFEDLDNDGVADGPGQTLATGMTGPITSIRQAGNLVLLAHGAATAPTISVFRSGASPDEPLVFAGDLDIDYPRPWQHETYALAVRPSPPTVGGFEVDFNVGSAANFPNTSANAVVEMSELATAALQADSIYRFTIEDNGGDIAVGGVERIAAGLRNAAGIAFHPATGDLYFEDNGIDGLVHAAEPLSADELNYIPAALLGGEVERFGFSDDYIEYRTGKRIGGGAVQPRVAFQPLPSPDGVESEGPSEIAFAPPGFPTGLNEGVFVGFHGQFNQSGLANEENPLVYVDLASGEYFHFLADDEPMIGHPNGLLATSDSLFVADLGTSLFGAPYGTGVVCQIKPFGLGDVNFDGIVDIFDVAAISAQWGKAGPLADANGDGSVDIIDVAAISSNWGCPASVGSGILLDGR